MAFKLAIGNIVQIPFKFTMREGALEKRFSFTFTGKRRTPEEIKEFEDRLQESQDEKEHKKTLESIRECLLENITDWTGQRFILLENNEPAAFDQEAFSFLLAQPGLLLGVWQAYQRECSSKEKN